MDADLVATGTTTAVVTVAVDDAIPVATTVTEETAVGTGVPVAANVTTDTTEVSDTTGEGDASGAAIVAAVVMFTTGVGETVGTGLAPIYRTVMGLGADGADVWEASKATGLR